MTLPDAFFGLPTRGSYFWIEFLFEVVELDEALQMCFERWYAAASISISAGFFCFRFCTSDSLAILMGQFQIWARMEIIYQNKETYRFVKQKCLETRMSLTDKRAGRSWQRLYSELWTQKQWSELTESLRDSELPVVCPVNPLNRSLRWWLKRKKILWIVL